jgi:hypothetical protein
MSDRCVWMMRAAARSDGRAAAARSRRPLVVLQPNHAKRRAAQRARVLALPPRKDALQVEVVACGGAARVGVVVVWGVRMMSPAARSTPPRIPPFAWRRRRRRRSGNSSNSSSSELTHAPQRVGMRGFSGV